jgi:hypothetical protein
MMLAANHAASNHATNLPCSQLKTMLTVNLTASQRLCQQTMLPAINAASRSYFQLTVSSANHAANHSCLQLTNRPLWSGCHPVQLECG